jgi:glycerophosphoryl diester phosphodiesterase
MAIGKGLLMILLTLCGAEFGNRSDRSAPARKVQVHGHRGARARMPENTLPAFEYAIRAGVDVLELDTAVTKDNVVVVSHDPILRPPVCTGPVPSALIHELTLAELRQWDCGAVQNPSFPLQTPVPGTRIPTLDEVLSLAERGSFDFNIETKIFPDNPQYAPPPDEFVRLVLEQFRKHKVEKRVILQSFDFRTLQAMKKLAPEIRLSALTSSDKRDYPLIAADAQAGIVSPRIDLVTADKIKGAHDARLEVIPWTANSEEEWDRMIDAGADAIITDDPAGLIAHLKKRGLR